MSTVDYNEWEDNDDEFNESGAGWESANDDPFEQDPEDRWSDIEEEDNDEIENEFWTGYYEKDDKQAALDKFLRVIELVNNGGVDTDDFKFKALTEIVVLYFHNAAYTETIEYFEQFLSASKSVKPNDLSSNLRKILNTIKTNQDVYDQVHELVMKEYKPTETVNNKSIGHLWFDLGIERCHDLMQTKIYMKCEHLIEELHESVKHKGIDDTSQS